MNNEYTWAEVHLERIRHNIQAVRKHLPSHVRWMAVVKADGYGHGAVSVARSALQAGAEELAVATLMEALQLRDNGIQAPILVLMPVTPQEVDLAVQRHISLTVASRHSLVDMKRYKTSRQPLRVHLKMDTGMGRIGIREKGEFIAMIPQLQADDVIVEGVYTHFATADQDQDRYCGLQFARFLEMRGWLRQAGFTEMRAHCANSPATIQYPEMALDMVRVGAAMYGIHASAEAVKRRRPISLRPTLSWHTRIIQVKKLPAGHSVGYDRHYITSSDEWIATLPIGYGDGYFRGLGSAHVLVNGQRAPIVGRICMNQMMVRLPAPVPVGTQVTLIGSQAGQEITIDELAQQIGSIPQQILHLLSPRIPRAYIEHDHMLEEDLMKAR